MDQILEIDLAEEGVLPSPEVLDIWAGGGDAPWPAAPEAPPIEDLRFRMGTRVACCVGKGNWVEGSVAALWYREAGFPAGYFAPYQIELDDGRFIFAPEDTNRCVRRI